MYLLHEQARHKTTMLSSTGHWKNVTLCDKTTVSFFVISSVTITAFVFPLLSQKIISKNHFGHIQYIAVDTPIIPHL